MLRSVRVTENMLIKVGDDRFLPIGERYDSKYDPLHEVTKERQDDLTEQEYRDGSTCT